MEWPSAHPLRAETQGVVAVVFASEGAMLCRGQRRSRRGPSRRRAEGRRGQRPETIEKQIGRDSAAWVQYLSFRTHSI
jgi:hypothetical protein